MPELCKGIFEPTSQLREVNQFFLLEEGVEDDRCQQRSFNFDIDQTNAIRLDSFLGDEDGYVTISGFSPNGSSDVTIINDSLYKIKIRLNDDKDYLNIEDGFSIQINDIEKDSTISFKRDHTVSGYFFNYVVENKAALKMNISRNKSLIREIAPGVFKSVTTPLRRLYH